MHSAGHLHLPHSDVMVAGKKLRFSEVNRNSRKRVDTLCTKEPTTLMWLESHTPGDVLIDVGGNVGMYSVYAAAVAGCRVYAFEPEALNYAELNKNIFLNGLHDRITAFCCAVGAESGLSTLYLSEFIAGTSHHDAGENRWEGPVTKIAPSAEARLPQGTCIVTLDDVVENGWVPHPELIKIDVDGLEDRVLRGAEELLRDDRLQSVLLETDFRNPTGRATIETMQGFGWQYSLDQVRMARFKLQTVGEWQKQLHDRAGGCNIIWFRKPHADKYETLFSQAAANYQPVAENP